VIRLDGLKVLDFCWVGAGAFVTRILADLGAEVIKVESRAHPDNLRLSGPHRPGAKALESSGYFASRNTSKKSIALNMTLPEGRAIAERLAVRCDIVTNNFRPGVMDKWSLGYDAIALANPSVIYLSMPMQGTAGPHRNYIGFGSTIAALCGLVNMAGLPDRPPLGTGTHYPDHVPNPGHALVALLAAVFHRMRTGEGQYIELAQIESTINVLGPSILQWSAEGTLPVCNGNRSIGVVPRGVFPCAAEETWCAIEVETDDQWRGLAAALGQPAWMDEPPLQTPAGRAARENEIERRLAELTRMFEAHALMALLQRHGVAASVVNTSADVLSDPQLVARGYWQSIPHAEMGEVVVNRPPFQVMGEGRPQLGPPPLLGEHTIEIARDWLGIDAAECRRLIDAQVFY
jgi:benzylsuccinate CoA-transferase BbsF subunit